MEYSAAGMRSGAAGLGGEGKGKSSREREEQGEQDNRDGGRSSGEQEELGRENERLRVSLVECRLLLQEQVRGAIVHLIVEGNEYEGVSEML